MAILWVKEVSGRSGRTDRDFNREYTKQFLVKSDRPDELESTIFRHRKIPKEWQEHPNDPGAFVDIVVPEQQDNKYLWDVEVEYTSEVEEPEKRKNPLNRPAEISYKSKDTKQIVTENSDDEPVLNTAGDYFDPPLEDDVSLWVISVKKNLAAVPSWIATYDNAINKGSITIEGITYAKHTLRLKGLQITKRKQEKNVKFRTVQFELHYDSRTHLLRPLNRGYRELVPVSGDSSERKLREIRVDGDLPSDPQFLDRDGKHIARPTRDEIVVLEVQPKSMKAKPFSRLPLDQ